MANIRKGRFTELAESLKSGLSRIKDTHLPTIRAYGELGQAKGLRAVNRGALKVVDALESAGVIRPRQATQARVGILATHERETMPYRNTTSGYLHRRDVEWKNPYSNRLLYEDMPKHMQDQFDEITNDRLGSDVNISDTVQTNSRLSHMLGRSLPYHDDMWSKMRTKDVLYPENSRTKKEFNNALREQYQKEVVDPAYRRWNRMADKEWEAVPKLRIGYQSLRNKAGLGLLAGAGGLGAGALALANRKKENIPSGSGRMNKSMAKRATPTKAQSSSNKYL